MGKCRYYELGLGLNGRSINNAILAAFLAAFLLCGHIIEAEEAGNSLSCTKETACRIEYDHLSSQETDPFLFSGRPMNKEHPRWHQYRKALRRFPDVRDCLVRTERLKPEPNLQLIGWRRVGWVKGFEVCLFRIGRSVGSVDRTIAWLTYHEFRVFSARRFRNDTYQPRFENDPMFSVQASWSKDYKNEAIGKPWFDFFPNSADTVNIVFNDNMRVAGVSAETTTK